MIARQERHLLIFTESDSDITRKIIDLGHATLDEDEYAQLDELAATNGFDMEIETVEEPIPDFQSLYEQCRKGMEF